MTDTTATSPTAQNYVLYRTQADGWQQVGYVIMAMTLPGPTAFTPPAGMAVGLDAAKDYPAGSIYPGPSTGYALTGAETSVAGTPLTLTLAPNNAGPQANTTVTLSDGGAGGTFSASSVTFDAGSTTAQEVTYTPKAAGTVAISATNNGALTNPGNLSVTVSAASAAGS